MEDVLRKLRSLTDELNQRDEDLKRSEEKFRSFFSEAAVPMTIYSISEARFVDANDAICAMLGYSKEEMTSRPVHLFVDGSQQDEIQRRVAARRAGAPPSPSMIVLYVKKNGDMLPLRWHVFNSTNKELIHSVAIDATHELLLEERVRELEARVAVLGGG